MVGPGGDRLSPRKGVSANKYFLAIATPFYHQRVPHRSKATLEHQLIKKFDKLPEDIRRLYGQLEDIAFPQSIQRSRSGRMTNGRRSTIFQPSARKGKGVSLTPMSSRNASPMPVRKLSGALPNSVTPQEKKARKFSLIKFFSGKD